MADYVRTLLENSFRSREREAVQVKSEKSGPQDTGDSDSDVHPTKKRKTIRGLCEELVFSARIDTRAQQSPRPAKGATFTEITAIKGAHATEIPALKKEHQSALKEAGFEEHRKHKDKQQEVVGPLKVALEKAKKTAPGAQVQVTDLKVQGNQEKALRVEVQGRLTQGQSRLTA